MNPVTKSEALSYPYRLRANAALLLLLIAAGTIYVGYGETFNSDRGVTIQNLFRLESTGARLFWGCACLLGLVLLAVTLRGIYLNLVVNRSVVLDAQAITLPSHRFSTNTVTIPYRDILELQLTRLRRHRQFTIRTRDRKFLVQSIFLPSDESFEELYAEIDARVRRTE